ncbi:hypothetical protein WDV93_03795 [Pantoea ananatis]
MPHALDAADDYLLGNHRQDPDLLKKLAPARTDDWLAALAAKWSAINGRTNATMTRGGNLSRCGVLIRTGSGASRYWRGFRVLCWLAIAIGPWGLGFISDVDEILHFSGAGRRVSDVYHRAERDPASFGPAHVLFLVSARRR